MTELITALDKITDLKVGENMNMEYNWSNELQDKLVQLQFQLTRTTNNDELKKQYNKILKEIFEQHQSTADLQYIKMLYKLIAYTRDIISGKGEYNLSYMLIDELFKFGQSEICPSIYRSSITYLCNEMITHFVRIENTQP